MKNYPSYMENDVQNPGHKMDPIIIESSDSSAIKILPYHELEGGTHKMVSVSGMYKTIPTGTERLIESTSGNTGYAASLYANQVGMPIDIFMPEGMSSQKVKMLTDLGASVTETPRAGYTSGARAAASEYQNEDPKTRHLFNQASNDGNWKSHQEIAYKLEGIDELSIIAGTGGTIVGLGRGIQKIHDTIITAIDLDAAPHFLNKKYNKPNEWNDHHVVGAAASKMSKITEDYYDQVNNIALIYNHACEKLLQESLKYKLNVGVSTLVNLIVAQKTAEKFKRVVGTVTFDDITRYEEMGNSHLTDFNFQKENIVKFLKSDIAKNFPISIESLQEEEKYSF